MGKRKLPAVITKEELEKKSTKELLGYLKNLQRCEESVELSDQGINRDETDPETIYFKQSKKWKTAYRTVKTILAAREHIH
jgi:hypothetical protein